MVNRHVKNFLYLLNSNPVSRLLFEKEVQKRAKLDFINVKRLAQNIPILSPFTKEIHKPNDWYGHANNLKIFLGLPIDYQFKFIMEHGLYLNDQVEQLEKEGDLPTFITYSKFREKILKRYREYVFSIGPFIHYAKSLLNQKQIQKEKQRLGRSVLFFPAHSTGVIGMDYDIGRLCRKIRKISTGYKTIRICLYWKDILLGRDKLYLNQGFECVTAGHMLDPLFLPRLRSLIEISDLTASNIISSQAGFSIHLNKPHIIINQKINLKTDTFWKKRIGEVFKSDGYNEVLAEFSKLNYKISSKQRRLVNKYWGSNLVKTRAQLKKIIDQTERNYRGR